MSRAVDAFPCGSRSTTSTWAPCRARHAARLTAEVVLPTPPFWLAIVMTRQAGGRGHSCSVSPSAASAAWAWLTATAPGAGAPIGTWAEAGMSTVAGRPSPTPARSCAGTGFLAEPAPGGAVDAVSGLPEAGTIGREPTRRLPCPAGASCSKSAPEPPAGFPRVLTVPLPCASSGARTFRASVSRETAADSACLTRTGGPTGSPSRKTRPCPSSPALPTFRAGPAASCPGPAAAGPAPATDHAVLGRRDGQPSPTVISLDSSRAAPSEKLAGPSGHPTPSGEAISALLPGQSCAVPNPMPLRSPAPGPAEGQPGPGPPAGPAPRPTHQGQFRSGRPIPPPSLVRGQPDHCCSRIDLTAPDDQNLRVPQTQPLERRLRVPDL